MKKRYLVFILLIVGIIFSGLFMAPLAEASYLTVTFPNGGEKLPIGSTQEIIWEGYEGHELDIYLSIDSGKNYDIYIGSGSGGSFIWTVPDISTDRARIKVTGLIQYFTRYHEPFTVEDTSDADFYIGRLPAAPTNLTAVPLSDSEIRLTWTDNADNETGFSIERNQHEIATVGADVETATQGSLPPATLYSYRVRAFNVFGYSDYSNTVRVATLSEQPILPPPEAPSSLTAVALSDSEILLTWTDNADNETGFTFERTDGKTDYVFTYHLHEKDKESAVKDGLKAETSYTYRIRAFNEAGHSSYSNKASATTLPPTDRETVIRFNVDSTEYLVDDSAKKMDTAPIIREGRTLLPIRYVAEPLGAEVEWDAEERKVIIILGETAMELWIDQNQARVNGFYQYIDELHHDVMPLIVPPGRTMLPLRFIAETLGCQVGWHAPTREVTVQYDPRYKPPEGWRLPEPPEDCPWHVIDFENLDSGTKVFHQYGSMGVSFPSVPSIIEPGDTGTVSGTKALSMYKLGEELSGKLVIEFTTGQTCVSMHVGLLEDTRGNKVLATLEAFDADRMLAIPGYGMEIFPAEQVAIQQRLIGPGPADIDTQIFVETGEEPLIYRVELSFSGGYVPVIDDLGFTIIGEPFSTDAPLPQITIETPGDGDYLSGFETEPDAFDLMGTIREKLMLNQVGVRVTQGDQVRESLLPFAGAAPDYTFGGLNIHGLLFPGENHIRVWAKSFSGKYGYSNTVQVHYEPLPTGAQAELLILTPGIFYEALEPLRDWKNVSGISSHIMTLDAIEREGRYGLADSRDLPERVKRTIARAYTYHGTRYVMLVGDGDRFPIRYHKAGREGVTWSWGVVYAITDLYYACLFKPDGTFDNWDGNNNDIIGEWWEPPTEWDVNTNAVDSFAQINVDDCGLKPHVAVGRIPATSISEVETYVSKVIEYEAESASPWFNRAVLWNANHDFRNDDEELRYVAEELLPTFTALKHLREEGLESFTEITQRLKEELRRDRIMQDINQGAGFAIFFGHGSRRSLGPLNAQNIADLENYGKYPVFIASACDTAKFVQEYDIYLDSDGKFPPCWPYCLPPHLPEPQGWEDPRPEPAPIQPSVVDVESMAEVLLFAQGKGGIGFLGATSGTNHASHPFVINFIDSWNKENVTRLGDMWTTGVREFVEHYLEPDFKWGKYNNVDFGRNPLQSRHIHIFALFGDPSLRLGR